MSGPSLSVIVFAFNEAENVGPVLQELRQWLASNEPDAEIVFVDDGSTDRTLEVAREALSGLAAKFARHEHNRGIGAALKTGVSQARAPWVTFMPADGQIEPESIGVLRAATRGRDQSRDRRRRAHAERAAFRDGDIDADADAHANGSVEADVDGYVEADVDGSVEADVDVVFSVYDNRDDGPYRKLLSFGVRALIFLVHGVEMQSDGPYLFRRGLFVPDQLPPDTFFLNFEFPIRVLSRGLQCRTVTIPCRPRRAGASKSTGIKRIGRVARDLVHLRVRRFREDRRR